MDVKNTQKWLREFMYCHTDVHDEQRSGRPSVSTGTIAKVQQEMLEYRHVTVHKLCERIPEVSKSTCAAWQESSMTRVYEKCHSASITMVIMSKNR